MARNSWTGQTLAGRYLIDNLIGHGGMSSVYKANDANLKRIVAVKLIHQHLTGDADFLRRFESEAEAVAQLRHSNIIQVFDFSQDEGQYYMIMEFVPGESLQERLARLNEASRRLSAGDVVKIAAGVCDAVEYAHKRGTIHRDIKPANILLSVQGEAILTDFGLAKLAGGTQHTAAGAVMGTALYMSPEQIRGEQVDHRTDIYALGVTLFEMLSGRPPFVADSAMTVLMMHLNDPLPDLREISPDASPELVEIVEKALAKDPGDRYSTAADMASSIRATDLVTPLAAADPPPDATMVARPGDGAASPPATPDATAVHRPEPTSQSSGPSSVGAPPPPIPPVAEEARDGSGGLPPWMFAVVGAVVIAVVIVALLVGGVFSGGDDNDGIVGGDTGTPTSTATTSGETVAPTEVVTQAPTATAILPPQYAQISDITIMDGRYVIDFETIGYEPVSDGIHTHFFFDTVPQEEAGVPGGGPWDLTYEASRYIGAGLTVENRPSGATQICTLVANFDHSIILNSGNCSPLPDA